MEQNNITKTKKITFMAMLLTLIVVLSIVESMFPTLPFFPPGVKLGLSNIVTMYSLFFMGKKEGLFLAILKSFFIFITRGTMSGILSFCGGISSITIILILIFIFKNKMSYIVISIIGAIFHNIGQLIAISLLLGSNYVFYYFPVLLISGIIMGSITGILLNTIMPVFDNLFKK